MIAPDFGRLAAEYDRVRPVDDNWREVFELVVREGDLRGTARARLRLRHGSSEPGARRDPPPRRSGASIPSRRCCAWPPDNVPASVGLKEGRAEDLPFRDGWFERAVMWLVCHLVDRPARRFASCAACSAATVGS